MKITDLCHTILNFAVLCSLLSDLCIDLPIATTGRTGLCVLQIGGGRGAYKKGIDDHSAICNISYFGHNLESSEPLYKLPNCRKGVKAEFLKERPEGSCWFDCSNFLVLLISKCSPPYDGPISGRFIRFVCGWMYIWRINH